MALTRNQKTAVALGGVIVVALALYLLPQDDVVSTVILEDRNGQCVVITKDPSVTVKKDKHVRWKIDNQCDNQNELVTVGNFRNPSPSTATDCLQPTQGTGVAWPFQEDINDRSKRQHTNSIRLKIKKDADLPGTPLPYDFDICTGQNAERKSDPRLVIER